MDYEEVKDAAKAARSKIDDLLSSLKPDLKQESNSRILLLQQSLRSVEDSDQVYDTVLSVLRRNQEETNDANDVPHLEIPASVMNAYSGQHNVIRLLHADEVKVLLGTGKFEVYVCLFSNEGKVSESPHGDYCDIDDDICYDMQALQQLRQTDPAAWESKWGGIQYARISQQIIQAILSSDLSLSVESAKEMTERALCESVSWLHADIPKLQSHYAIQKAFEGLGYDLKQRDKLKSKIQIEIGNKHWVDGSFGVGMILNSTITVELHQELSIPDNESDSNFILLAHCLIRAAVPLCIGKGSSDSDVFCDCLAIDTQESKIFQPEGELLFECRQMALGISFYEPSFSGTYEYPLKRSRSIHKNECRKSIKEVISEFVNETSKELPMNTTLGCWGDIFNYSPNYARNKGKTENPIESAEIIFDSISAREVIRSVECSSCHILALTNLGMVYSYGDGSHGQLGHGSLEFCCNLRRIAYFLEGSKTEINRIVQISAGSGRVGSYSAAIDDKGNLYSWGKTIMCGHFPEMRQNVRVESLTLEPKKVKALEQYFAVKVSCGDDYTILLTRDEGSQGDDDTPSTESDVSNKVFSWGIAANGRLGHGRPKKVSGSGSRRKTRGKSGEICELKPSIILALDNEQIIDISAGKRHSLAISKDGRVFTWGSNAFGQCGVVQHDTHFNALVRKGRKDNDVNEERPPGIWDDVWLPRYLQEFGPMTGKVVISISAGGIHSAAIDSEGKLYTWGGGGDNHCLGHGDVFKYRHGFDLPSDSRRRKLLAMAGNLEVPLWGRPREIKCLGGERMRFVDLGEYDGAAISESGRMYVWGEKSNKLQMKTAQVNGSFKSSVNSTSTPMAFNELCSLFSTQKYVHDIACGMDTIFYISSNSKCANILGRHLYDECQVMRRTHDEHDNETLVDCILMCIDGKLFCHRVIIAHRSPVLDQMLAMEVRPQDVSKYTELIVPGIRYQIMKEVLCFLYTDTIPDFHLSSFDTLVQLWEASHALMIEQLMHKCKEILEKDYNYSISSDTDFIFPPIDATRKQNSSFGSDLNIALQEERFSDVSITTEDKRTIHAHQCIIGATSEYFANVLDMAKGNKRGSKIMLELPGTYAGVMRVLGYLYTGYLPPSNHENDLVEDLENAHRYKLADLKSLCDNRIQVTEANACDMLLLAHTVQSPRLRMRSMHMIVKTLGTQFQDESKKKRFESIISQCPMGILDELFEYIKENNGSGCILPPDRKLLAADLQKRYLLQKSRIETQMANELTGKDAKGLSTKSLILLLILAIGYANLQQFMSVKGLVPVINCLVLVATCIYFFLRIV